jgi:hypothetical protein
MSTNSPLSIPPPAEIRARLAAIVAEARALRRLLRLAEAAARAQEARQHREAIRPTRQEVPGAS